MFTFLKLRNFKSFGEIEADFRGKYKKPKNMIFIYGENGSGKSNLISAFIFLKDTIRTMNFQNLLQELIKNQKDSQKKLNDDLLIDFIKKSYKDLDELIKDNRTIGTSEILTLEYGFNLNEKEGKYLISFNPDNSILEEKLTYLIEERSGIIFELNNDKTYLNNTIFFDNLYKDELLKQLEKYWGKHSFLSILNNELEIKNVKYIQNNLSINLSNVLDFFNKFSVNCKLGNYGSEGYTGVKHPILIELDNGTISKDEKSILSIAENTIRNFFTGLYSDIKDVFYEIEEKDDKLKYQLFLKKIINGNISKVNFNLESTGTQKLLEILPTLLQASVGNCTLIDEIDSGIHDLLVTNIIKELSFSINGQLIATTHNTLLLESLDKESIYFLNVSGPGIKTLKCLTEYEGRIQNHNNNRIRYLKGMYDAIPYINHVDFNELKEDFNKILDKVD